MKSSQSRHAVILSGGGANGAYEVGVLKALLSGNCPISEGEPVEPAIYCGTSVGSYNAAAAVAASSLEPSEVAEHLETLWLERVAENPDTCANGVYRMRGDPRRMLDPRCLVSNPSLPAGRVADDAGFLTVDMLRRAAAFTFSGEPFDRRAISAINLASLVDVSPLRELITDTIDLEQIRNSEKSLHIAATNWLNGSLKLFSNQDMVEGTGHEAILASCAIPVFFPPVEVDGYFYVDGGVVLNTPLLPAIEAGAEVVHAIYLDPDVESIPYEGLQNSMDTLCRMIVIMQAQHLNRDIDLVATYNQLITQEKDPTNATSPAGRLFEVARLLSRQGNRTPSPITVHRYRPGEVLSALVGILKFGRKRLAALIEEGWSEAVEHDCQANSCIVP